MYASYAEDYFSLPEFPDLTNATKAKCCPEGSILTQGEGVWSCAGHSSKLGEHIISAFRNLDITGGGSHLQIEHNLESLDSVCDTNEAIYFWMPHSVDFMDNLAMSNSEEEYFECIDVTWDNLTDQMYPVVASCIEQDQLQTCESGKTERIILLGFGILSILAISTALIVYTLLAKQLLNVHGKVGGFSCLCY